MALRFLTLTEPVSHLLSILPSTPVRTFRDHSSSEAPIFLFHSRDLGDKLAIVAVIATFFPGWLLIACGFRLKHRERPENFGASTSLSNFSKCTLKLNQRHHRLSHPPDHPDSMLVPISSATQAIAATA
jgi:hypothetical protein